MTSHTVETTVHVLNEGKSIFRHLFADRQSCNICTPGMNTNDNCDGAGPHTEGEVRYLPANACAGHFLCRTCYAKEKIWRWLRNRDLPSWAELEVYPKPDVAKEHT